MQMGELFRKCNPGELAGREKTSRYPTGGKLGKVAEEGGLGMAGGLQGFHRTVKPGWRKAWDAVLGCWAR